MSPSWKIRSHRQRDVVMIFVTGEQNGGVWIESKRGEKDEDKVHTSRIVSVCDIIWMLTWDWLVGKLSVERDLARDREPVRTFLLLRAISVRRNTLDMYAELSPRIRKAVRRNFAGVTCKGKASWQINRTSTFHGVYVHNVCLYNAVHVSNGFRWPQPVRSTTYRYLSAEPG